MKVAITGAAGYLGRQIVSKLRKDKRIKNIIAIDRVPVSITDKKVKSVVCDITSPDIAKIIFGCDVVIHLAFIIGDSTNRPALYRVNVDGSRNVFEAGAKGGAKHLIVASSIAVYGYYPDNPKVIDEAHPLRGNPDNAYSDTKRLVELLLDDFEKRYPKISVIRFRPGVILGPNTHNNFRTLFKLPFWVDFKPGKGFWNKASCVHEDDVVDAFILGVFRQKSGIYNLAALPFVTRKDILIRTHQIPIELPASPIGKFMDITYKLKISNSSSSDLIYAMYPIPASGEKAIRELKWKPKYSGLQALDELLKSIREEGRKIFDKY